MVTSSGQSAQRLARLQKTFFAIIHGNRSINSKNDAELYIESICAQEDKQFCVEKLATSSQGLNALKNAVRLHSTDEFINGAAKDLILYLDDPAVELLCAGQLRKQLLAAIVDPPTFWNELVAAAKSKRLQGRAELAFTWLLLQIICWVDSPVDVDVTAQEIVDAELFSNSPDDATRKLSQRIDHALRAKHGNLPVLASGPGGRHDNDKVDYRQISIFPTNEELACKETPYYRRADSLGELPMDSRVHAHFDNQFRLLREDFLAELRDEIDAARQTPGARRRNMQLTALSFLGSYFGNIRFATPFALVFAVGHGLESFAALPEDQRRAHLKNNPKFLPNEAFGCILLDGDIVSFATLLRAEDPLMEDKPAITLVVPSDESLKKVLMTLNNTVDLQFVRMNTPTFAYEPILRCLQSKLELPLSELLLSAKDEERGSINLLSDVAPLDIVDHLEATGGEDIQGIFQLPKPVQLDSSQLESLVSGLRQPVSLIQGPPGTGKSFIGALVAKALFDNTKEKILVLCFTNHALDQFLEDLMDIGINQSAMVRLGSKSSARTQALSLSNQARGSQRSFDVINKLKGEMEMQKLAVDEHLKAYANFRPSAPNMLDYLEFAEEDWEYYYALKTPDLDEDEQIVDRKGKAISKYYIFERWSQGRGPGVLAKAVPESYAHVWKMDKETRQSKIQSWVQQQRKELVDQINETVRCYNAKEALLRNAWAQQYGDVIRQKRIIACTTTGAAKYTDHIQTASPGVVLVEEAGEILESHVLTAMTPSTRQLILIGDHQQLRPKVNAYALSVEKGDGYDLNRSLFERLILAGFPHTTLHEQYRMCPEISSLIRELAYPALKDAPSTIGREQMRGIGARVLFIDHCNPERAAPQIADRRDQGGSVSKQNQWEVSMVLKVVRYMAQQGYGTSKQVVLTPYLGQLHLLREALAKDNDPVLNDLDSFDLVRAGLMVPASAAHVKKPIKISTIDNYQGEESDIVIISLTRSNANGDIGFMSSPERLNVLLSRARQAMILIGNSKTFLARPKGQETWEPLFDMLATNGSIHDGLPVICSQHSDWRRVLKEPSDFDEYCPDGGCPVPCGIELSCKLHQCPRRCHKSIDHSRVKCEQFVSDQCPKGHTMTWQCFVLRPASCATCDEDARRIAEKQQRDMELEHSRQSKQQAYMRQLAEIDDQIDLQRRLMKEQQESIHRRKTLRQRAEDLANVQVQYTASLEKHQTAQSSKPTASAMPGSDPASLDAEPPSDSAVDDASKRFEPLQSTSRDEWQRQKELEGAQSAALDELTDMIGLENVKEAFLDIKATIDLKIRQHADMSKQRFGAALLGNSGTGKTTVARLYAKFLTTVGALAGHHVVETAGSKLANEGVQGCRKMIEEIQNKGGGALFIDEAYQLSSGSSYGGAAVLDFLLAEVENLTGKVVFILAGYNKEMESFFSHNPGIPSRFPRSLQFADYEDSELLDILNHVVHNRYDGQMLLEWGAKGLYARIIARRIGRGRGRPGFGNARAVENQLAVIESRQAKRISKARRTGEQPADFLLTKEDLIGPVPAEALKGNRSWKRLQELVGLTAVKESVNALFTSIETNYDRELQEQPMIDFNLNRVFLGSPGTGKTTVAKLYGQILADLGLLSTGEVILKNPADFVGNVLGASEANTKGILQSARGKVLVIDEAYGLHASRAGTASDPYKAAVIDTIVAEVQSVPGDDQCVLLLGYKEQMEEMMQNANPGLARRFPIDSAFVFEDFDDDQIAKVLDLKLELQHFEATSKARSVALQSLSRARDRPNFGNAGEVDILLDKAKVNQQKRISRDKTVSSTKLEAVDFDPDYERAERATTDFAMLFKGFVGADKLITQLQRYQTIAANARSLGLDPKEEIPFNFLFRGPPGTGKTTVARKMGKVYYDMGFLATAEVIDCSAKDLIGEYVGQTGPKTDKLIESALGKVLFIDEAYRLAGGMFAKEAMDELVDCITKPKYFQKLIIILAGYDKDINHLMSINPGLTSRFPEQVDFPPMEPDHCIQQLTEILQRKPIDISVLSTPSDAFRERVIGLFQLLCSLDNFGNGRDVKTLAKTISSGLLSSHTGQKRGMVLAEVHVTAALENMVDERTKRARDGLAGSIRELDGTGQQLQSKTLPPLPHHPTSVQKATQSTMSPTERIEKASAETELGASQASDDGESDEPNNVPSRVETRDAGVSDAIWEQLQKDKMKALQEARELERLAEEERKLKDWLAKCEDAKRKRELEEIERKRKALEEQKRQEAAAKAKLMQLGRCPVGYQWIKQSGGYRCGGGSHWIAEGDVNKLMGS